ncbi:multifunctional virulence effector protein DrrA [Legionella steelei]|uniref:Multifunctional virulence effector protein DrrA n=1 Tax=Legionella steelei TaxID=947033 RepID=A0A0W0ZLX5_9GAMM|nr:hypothetical protein [Legionella steelei]KTD70129.1 multifunctional virulence effector protein DrrA [Legionella steelei]
MISAARARTLLARYQQDFLNMQEEIVTNRAGWRMDEYVLPHLIQALESIAYGRPFTPTTKIPSDPQKAISLLLGDLDQRFLEAHFNEGGKKIISNFIENAQALPLEPLSDNNYVNRIVVLQNGSYRIEGESDIGEYRAITIDINGNATGHNGSTVLGRVGDPMSQQRDKIYAHFKMPPPAPPIDKAEFITSTRKLIAEGVFDGRSEQFKNSLLLLCDAYEKGQQSIDGRLISAQISTWGMRPVAEGFINVDTAWNLLFQQMGNLNNDVYKSAIRSNLQNAFNQDASYSPTIKAMWFDAFLDQDGPKPNSKYANLAGFISNHTMPTSKTFMTSDDVPIGHKQPKPTAKTFMTSDDVPIGHKQSFSTSKKSSPQQMHSTNDQAKFIQQFILHHASGVTRPPLIQGDKVKIEFQNSNHLFEFQNANKKYMANIEVQVAGPGKKAFLTMPIAQIRQMENDAVHSKYEHFVTSNQGNRKVDTLASTSSLSSNFKDRYKTHQGDFLKSTILKDFYEDLQKASSSTEVAKVVKKYEDDGRYAILATAQNSTMQALSFMKTSSAKAFSDLKDERLAEIKNEHKKGHACS